MKKALLLLASTALLLVGCAKEQIVDLQEGGLTNVTFTANLDNGVATKAVADNDGKGTYVNRCIMEIYFQNQLYKRMEAAMSGTPATATFANVPVVAGKQYQILFWADCGGDGQIDKYYTTKTEGEGNNGLKAVTVNKTNFIDALKAKKNDELDAFFAASNYTVSQQAGGNSFTVKLHRPFAQLNVITTDVADGKTVTCADLLPEKVSVSYTAATTFNVADSTVTGSATYAYEAPVYGDKTNWETVKTRGEFTLSMDYILADKEQGAVNVTFKTLNGTTEVMTHSLTNLPYKRNYRTNVKGELLTVGGTWKAEIDTTWSSPDIVKVVEVADIHSANQIINQYKETTDHLEVKFTAEPNDSGQPTGEETSSAKAIVTTPIKEGKTLSIEVLAQTRKLYVGDYPNEYTVENTVEANHAVVNINVPQSSSIVTLVINAPSKSVYINGKQVASVGTITSLDAITSQNTLIIEKNQQVGTLTMHQGGLEIHGTVTTLAITENAHDTNPVKVRTSENLSQDVFDVIYKAGDGGHDYIDRPAYSEKKNANGTWDIVPSVCKIGETAYGSLNDAVGAVTEGVLTTITMIRNHEILGNAGVVIPDTKKIILDLNGKTINNLVTESAGSQIITNKGTLKITGNGTLTNTLAENVNPGEWSKYNYVTNLISNYGELTIENGTFTCTPSSSIAYTIDNKSESGDAVVTIDGGDFIAAGNASIRMFCCSTTKANTVTINGGYFEGYYYAVSISNASAYPSVPNENVGALIINGGEFESRAEEYNTCISYWNDTASPNISVTITEGKFNDYVVISQNPSVTGGLYKYDSFTDTDPDPADVYKLSNYVPEGYAVVANTDAATKAEYPYTVKVKPVVKIGNVEYADIADAFAAITTSTPTTVTLLENIGSKVGDVINWKEYDRKFAYTVNANQNITFDLNGKKIYAKTTVTGYTGFLLVKNGGSLTIKDSAGGGELNYLDGMDNEGGLAISSEGSLTILSGTIENCTYGPNSAIQGAIDVHANEWGSMYEHELKFSMSGGVLKSNGNNTLRIFDSSQTGTGSVIIEFEITGGEVYGKDAIFIQPQWTKEYCQNSTYMNKVKVSVKGGTFDTTNGIRVYGAVNETNDKEYRAVQISVTGGNFTIRSDKDEKYRVNHVAFQNGDSTEGATAALRSYTDVSWTASDPIYSTPAQQ